MKEPKTIREMEKQLRARGVSRAASKRLLSQMKSVAREPAQVDVRSKLAEAAQRIMNVLTSNTAKD